ncbi:CPA2 family monovalent cation:H+ antiporter-2 [Ereboglobus sp. PH5-5]|uniref:cation:proton antiporter n=1 Tax=Ereboglobus sp. PH5-5 TaxID=2940529 RepID=UPI00240689C9|nr:cation:proton antiporter [Ereboglobus sp. PH5-5]MDF9833784.1 CPA2 family monovalent cation:H+ antiporter-2 [Ereboglobus sp. PH5-5]
MDQGIFFIQDLALVLVVAAAAGWVCQRIGLSVVVGYLMAGMLISLHPFTETMLQDTARIERLAQVGLVFLMFGIGLRLSLRRLRRLGLSVMLAVFVSASTIYYITRMVATGVFAMPPMQGLFLAGMLMVSSSAIISKVLEETGGAHERAGQTAMGVVVLEDVVAVILVAVLNSVAKFGSTQEAHIGSTLGTFAMFVLMAGVAGLLFVPWLLRKLSISASGELQTVAVAGILLGLALLANEAGYSLALGSFLLGMIVAETPQRIQVERTFEGMTDVFSSVFFVAIGLQIEPGLLLSSWKMIVAVAVLTIVVRTFAVSFGLSLIGTPLRNAFRAGLMVTPIGEFSFIIAQVGVAALLVPKEFYPIAVGVSLLTTVCAPSLTRNAGKISKAIVNRMPGWMRTWHSYYNTQLDQLKMRSKKNMLWQLSRKRIIQVAVEVLMVTGVMVFSRPLLGLLTDWLGEDWLFPNGLFVLFWLLMMIVVLAPLVALWRNLSALSLLYAQVLVPRRATGSHRLRPVMEAMFKILAATIMFVWFFTLLPSMPGTRWFLLTSVLAAAVLLFMLRRRLIYWHSEMESELHSMLNHPAQLGVETAAPWLAMRDDWGIRATSCTLPDLVDCQGKRINELDLRALYGCVITGIERQGVMIPHPSPEEVLYPRDKVLLIGTEEQVAAGKKMLTSVSGRACTTEFDDVSIDTLLVPPDSRAAGKDLRSLALAQTHRVQILGIRRENRRILNPDGNEVLMAGDELLVISTPDELRAFNAWLAESGETEE